MNSTFNTDNSLLTSVTETTNFVKSLIPIFGYTDNLLNFEMYVFSSRSFYIQKSFPLNSAYKMAYFYQWKKQAQSLFGETHF